MTVMSVRCGCGDVTILQHVLPDGHRVWGCMHCDTPCKAPRPCNMCRRIGVPEAFL